MYPSLLVSITYGLISVAAYLKASDITTPYQWRMFLYAVVIAGVFGAFWSFFDWFFFVLGRHIEGINQAREVETNEYKIVDKLSRMNPQQLGAIGKFVPVVTIVAGHNGPDKKLETPMGYVPFEFITEFLAKGNEYYMAAEDRWPDKSEGHDYAVWFTEYMKVLHFADKARGMRSAKWLDYHGAMISIGLEEPDEAQP